MAFSATAIFSSFDQPNWRHRLIVLGIVVFVIVAIVSVIINGVRRSQASFLSRSDMVASSSATTPKEEPKLPTTLPHGPLANDAEAIAVASALNQARFGDEHWDALYKLWTRESNWNPEALNASSGACGIPQALPCHQITDQTMYGQIQWGLDYIRARYGNPTNAWAYWQRHHWY